MFTYLITCKPTGKYYVGQHAGKSLSAYLRHKWRRANRTSLGNHLFNTFRKYPLADFDIVALTEPLSKKGMNVAERAWIVALDARNPEVGLNTSAGGELSWLGLKHAAASIEKMKANPNRPHGFKDDAARVAHCVAMTGAGNPMFGKTHSEAVRVRCRPKTTWEGRTHSAETIAKMRRSAKARWARAHNA